MKRILLLPAILYTLHCTAQTKPTYFEDHFDDNRNGWLSSDTTENTGLKIEGGSLLMDGSTGRHTAGIVKSIDNDRDFEIELTYTVLKRPGKYDNSGRIFWGLSDSLGSSWIGLSTNPLRFTYCHGGNHKNDKHKNVYAFPHPKLDKPVHLTIRKISDKYYIIVNGKQERKLPFEKLPGNEIALDVAKDSALKIDELSIKYLN